LVTDARILAGKVDAVLFVVWLRKTTTERAKASLELFKRVGAPVIGKS
jgi:Mrp family chromosome partitioning ATPase